MNYTEARHLILKPPEEFLGELEAALAGGLSYRAGLLVRQRLRAVKNDSTLSADIRSQAERLWRKLCRQRVSISKSIPSSQTANETGTPVHNVDEGVDPLAKLLPSLRAYERMEKAEQAWVGKHGPLQNSGWSLGTCDSCGRNDWVAQRLTPSGLQWLDFACYQNVDESWEEAEAENKFLAALAAKLGK